MKPIKFKLENNKIFNNILLLNKTTNKIQILAIDKIRNLLSEKQDLIIISYNNKKQPICIIDNFNKYIYQINKNKKKIHNKSTKRKKINIKITSNNNSVLIASNKILQLLNKKKLIEINITNIRGYHFKYNNTGQRLGLKLNIILRSIEILYKIIFFLDKNLIQYNIIVSDKNLLNILQKKEDKNVFSQNNVEITEDISTKYSSYFCKTKNFSIIIINKK